MHDERVHLLRLDRGNVGHSARIDQPDHVWDLLESDVHLVAGLLLECGCQITDCGDDPYAGQNRDRRRLGRQRG